MDHSIVEILFSQARFLACVLILPIYLVLLVRHVSKSSRAAPKVASTQPRTTQLLPCSISHCRLFPKKHSFKYPYLAVGVPVRSPSSNWLLSVDNKPWWQRGWFHVSPRDHLHRGRDGATLSENIDAYLKLQGLKPFDYPFIYLLTSPRFLNYAFKPASFWFLYTQDCTLAHIVAEVNNTFGERRMYLFKAPPNGSSLFKSTMPKDFHVSPFSSRKGSYMLSSSDPMIKDRISLTVALRSSKEHTKLIAKWWSIGPAIDPATISLLDSLWLILSWGPTILTTFPKIVFEAIVLAQVRRLHVWYRPEPRETAIPRQPNANETYLASVFAQYLQFFWAQSKDTYSVSILPRHQNNDGLPGHGPYGLLHMRITKVDDKPQTLSLTVHSPQFYRQINTCRTLSELLEIALLDPHVENRTAWSDDAVALVSHTKNVERAMEEAKSSGRMDDSSWFNPCKAVWILYRWLLCARPLPGVYPYPAIPAARTARNGLQKVRPGSDQLVSELFLDSFVAQECGIVSQFFYMVVALRLRWRTWLVGIIGGE